MTDSHSSDSKPVSPEHARRRKPFFRNIQLEPERCCSSPFAMLLLRARWSTLLGSNGDATVEEVHVRVSICGPQLAGYGVVRFPKVQRILFCD